MYSDRKLGIRTSGIREQVKYNALYNRIEPTDYEVLDRLFTSYNRPLPGRMVDVGAGKGRAAICFYHHYKHPVLAIEADERAVSELVQNISSYEIKHGASDIQVWQGDASDYSIQPDDCVFYFFNPFLVQIFYHFLSELAESLAMAPRQVDLILYYPSYAFRHALHTYFPLANIKRIEFNLSDEREVILIYRLNCNEDFKQEKHNDV